MTSEEVKKALYENILSGDFDLTEEIARRAISEKY